VVPGRKPRGVLLPFGFGPLWDVLFHRVDTATVCSPNFYRLAQRFEINSFAAWRTRRRISRILTRPVGRRAIILSLHLDPLLSQSHSGSIVPYDSREE
jgi:hypothetical protein